MSADGVGVSGQERITVERCPRGCFCFERVCPIHGVPTERHSALLLPSSVVGRDEAIERAAEAMKARKRDIETENVGLLTAGFAALAEAALSSVGFFGEKDG